MHRGTVPALRRLIGLVAWTLLHGAAFAHDSWLHTSTSPTPHEVVQLSTGSRFPVGDSAPTPWNVVRAGCADRDGAFALRPGERLQRSLAFVAEAPRPAPPLTCWTELDALDVEIAPPLVPVYMRDIRPPGAVLEVVRDYAARAVPWRETYRKFARIELAAAAKASGEELRRARAPLGWGLEIVVEGDAPIAVNHRVALQMLRDGVPLPGLAVEAINERSGIGLWLQSGAGGRFTMQLPLRGRWIFRATELQLPAAGSTRWYSRFTTFVVEVP